jgi:glyoxylate reductase
MPGRPKILVTQKIPQPAYPLLEEVGDVEANMQEGYVWSYDELLQRTPGHDYIDCLLTDTIDAHLLEACAASTPRLKLVANMAVGYNNYVRASSPIGDHCFSVAWISIMPLWAFLARDASER